MTNGDGPVTKADLAQLKAELIEAMRDMQTEILRGFEAWSGGQSAALST